MRNPNGLEDSMSDFKQLSGTEGLEKLGSLIEDIHICMLTTAASDGSFDSRPMATQKLPKSNFDRTLWFLTSQASEKAREIADDSHVSLLYSDPVNAKFVSVKGRAFLSRDRQKIHELWNPMYSAWFPGGEEDPQITVLRVDISEADYWQASSSKIVRSIKYLAASVTKGKVDVGEYGNVTVATK
jgi:general stress protein 26